MSPDWDQFVTHGWGVERQRWTDARPVDLAPVLAGIQDALWGSPTRYAPMSRVYIEGRRTPTPLGPVDDQAPPGSIDELLDRVRRACGRSRGEVTVVVNDLQIASPQALEQAQRFIAPLVARVGVATDRLGIDVFAGDYAQLPFGLHRDPSENFLCCVQGVRRITMETDGEREVIDLEAGDVLYWPADTPHVGACPQGPSLAVAIGWWTQSSTTDDAVHALSGPWRRALGEGERSIAYGPGSPTSVPVALQEAAEAVRRVHADDTLAKSALLEHWLSKCSALGFHPLPRGRDSSAPEGVELRKRCPGPLLSALDGGDVVVAANGGVGRFGPEAEASVARLEAGEGLIVDAASKELIDSLWRWRALG